MTFNSAQAGIAVQATYRYNLTVAQSINLFQQDTPNHPDANLFAAVGVGKGKGRLFTLNYDASQNWATATPTATAAGLIGASGAAIPGCRVVSVPSVGDPFLGIEFNV
jgi:hypothetical protein